MGNDMATATAKPTEPPPRQSGTVAIPCISDRLVYWFHWYLQRFFPKHFHSFAVSNAVQLQQIPSDASLIVFVNHASWWDPLVALVLGRRYFPDRKLFAPIDAAALKKYPFMERLGFFAVEQESLQGAGSFLKTARAILDDPGNSIWLTPEGQFADPRQRDLSFQPGLAHLASKLKVGVLLPVAIEYPFWEERLPEVLVRVGKPILVAEHAGVGKEQWQAILESGLRDAQTKLEADSIHRRSDNFEIVMSGKLGVNWLYDSMRRSIAWIKGGRIEKNHGEKLQ